MVYTVDFLGDAQLKCRNISLDGVRIRAQEYVGLQAVTDVNNETSNTIAISNVTQSTSQTTGAFTVSGGVGIAKDLHASKIVANTPSSDSNGSQLNVGNLQGSYLALGAHTEYSWMQSRNSKPLSLNALGNNVGIGTTTPEDNLHIHANEAGGTQLKIENTYTTGDSRAGLFLQTRNSDNFALQFTPTNDSIILDNKGQGGYSFYQKDSGGTTNNVMQILPNGNVGIGTANPALNLDNYYNSARIAGTTQYYVSGTSTNTTTYIYIGRFTTYGTVTVNFTASGSSSFSANYATFTRQFNDKPTVAYLLNGDQYTTHHFYYQSVDFYSYDVWHRQDNLTNLAMRFHVSGPSISLPTEPSSPTLTECAYGHRAKQWPGGGLLYNTFDGRVGIGTASPSYKLNVLTDTNYDGISLRDSTRELLKIAKGNNGAYINMFDSGVSQVNISTSGNSWINGGNVGIGTSSPSHKLTVAAASGDAEVHIQAQGNGSTGAIIYFNGSATNQRKCAILSSPINSWCRQDLHFCHNTSLNYDDATIADSKMVITNAGNVGIGFTNPGLPLQVNGTIRGTTLSVNGVGYMVSGNGNLSPNVGKDTGISLYASTGGGSIYLMISAQNNAGSQTGTWVYIVRRYYSTQNTWTNSSATVKELAAMNGMTIPNPGNPTLSLNSTTGRLEFSFGTAVNYKFTAYVI